MKSQSPKGSFTRKTIPSRVTVESELKPLLLKNIFLNWVSVRQFYHYGPHKHTQYELLMPLKGTYRCTLNGSQLSLKPGTLLFVQEDDIHEDFYQKGNHFVAFLFNIQDFGGRSWAHGVFASNTSAASRIISLLKFPSLSSLARLIQHESQNRKHGSLSTDTLIEAFFWLLVEKLPQKKLSTPFLNSLVSSSFRKALFECFSRNLNTQLSMKELAQRLGISERSLDNQCKKILGTSPAKAFTAYRMHEASRLLSMGMRVQEVSNALQFSNPFHFSKVFKRCTGRSPSQIQS